MKSQIICKHCGKNKTKKFDTQSEMWAEMYWHKKGYCKTEKKRNSVMYYGKRRRFAKCTRCERKMPIVAKGLCSSCYVYTNYPDYYKNFALKRWKNKHKEILDYRRKYYQKHSKKILCKQREWYARNKHKKTS